MFHGIACYVQDLIPLKMHCITPSYDLEVGRGCKIRCHPCHLNKGHRRFREGRENVEDDKRSGRPQSLPLDVCRAPHTAENIEKVPAVVRENRPQTIAESVGISEATCQWILTWIFTFIGCVNISFPAF
ncbi:hypothetical protein TNCV_1305451 [Trichonephila clavipes]|nr:hypothetical protein TNCV_1305451 [Trichonephila clavipes]